MEDLSYQLLRIGFRENEARAYLAALELGRANATAIARKAGMGRTTAHHVLHALVKRSLISVIDRSGEHIFVAESPERIRSLLSFQMQELTEKQALADKLMLRLNVFHNTSGQKPKIRYIESIDGLRVMQSEYEKLKGDIIQILNYDRFLAIHDSGLSKSHREALRKQGRKVRSIVVTARDAFQVSGHDIICVHPSIAPMDGEMTVCGDRLVLFSYQSGFIAVEIASKSIADTARVTLEFAWKEVERLNANTKAPN